MFGSNSENRLLTLVQGVEALLEEKAAIAERISEMKRVAKHAGYSLQVFNMMLRERQQTPDQRRAIAELAQLYRAQLGMLDGTPLGDAARERLMHKHEPLPPPQDPDDLGEETAHEPHDFAPSPDAPVPPAAEEIEAARQDGRDAARSGVSVMGNPHPAQDPRRAAWDEGWCAEMGTDGMDIPKELQRKPKAAPSPDTPHTAPEPGDPKPDDIDPPTAPKEGAEPPAPKASKPSTKRTKPPAKGKKP